MPRKPPSTELPFHPACNLFPQHTDKGRTEMAADIKANGQRFPILTFEGQIIDGRGRYKACQLAGVEPWIEEWEGEAKDLILFVISVNLHRRHLDESQRAMVGAGLEAMLRETPRANLPAGRIRDMAAEATNVSSRSLASAIKVRDEGTPELKEAVVRGDVAVSKAAKIADQSPADQARAINDEAKRARKAEDADVLQTIIARGHKELARTVKTFSKADGRDGLPAGFEEHTAYLEIALNYFDRVVEVA